MTLEAYVKSTVYDMSGGLLPAPADDGYNIVLSAYTPTGPTVKTKVMSQKDFVDKYLMGTTILPTDHFSAVFTYMLLAQNPVYVMRACPVNILEGIGSDGNRYLFDRGFNLLNEYKWFNIDIQPKAEDFKIDVFTGNNLDSLVNGLVEEDSKRANSRGILSSGEGSIVSRLALTHSNNIGLFDEVSRSGYFHDIEFEAASHLKNEDSVTINGTGFQYLGLADTVNTSMPNATKYTSASDSALLFGLFIAGQTGATSHFQQVAIKLSDISDIESSVPGISNNSDNAFVFAYNTAISADSCGSLNGTYEHCFKDMTNFDKPVKGAKVGDQYLAYSSSLIPEAVYTVTDNNWGSEPQGNESFAAWNNNGQYKYTNNNMALNDNEFNYIIDNGKVGITWVTTGGTYHSYDISKGSNIIVIGDDTPNEIKEFGNFKSDLSTIEDGTPAMRFTLAEGGENLTVADGVISNHEFDSNFVYNKAQNDLVANTFCLVKSNNETTLYYCNVSGINSFVINQDSAICSDGNVKSLGLSLNKVVWDAYEKEYDNWVYFYIDENGDVACKIGCVKQGCYVPVTSKSNAVLPQALCLSFSHNSVKHVFYNTAEKFDNTSNLDGELVNHFISTANSAEFLSQVINLCTNNSLIPGCNVSDINGVANLYIPTTGQAAVAADGRIGFMTDDNSVKTYFYQVSNSSNNSNYVTYDYIWVAIGDYFYYTKSENADSAFLGNAGAKTQINLLGKNKFKAVTKDEFLAKLQYQLNKTQSIGVYDGNFITDNTRLNITAGIDNTEGSIAVSGDTVAQSKTAMFAIVQKFPSKSAVFKFDYTLNEDDSNIINLNLNYKGGINTETWTMSFVPGVADGYGVDQWYTRVNSDNFQVVKLKGEGGEIFAGGYASPAFGDLVSVPEFDTNYMSDAISELTEYEDGLHYDIISDAGVIDTSLGMVINSLAKEIKAVYPASLPTEVTNTADIISYVSAANFHSEGNYEVRLLSAGDRLAVSGFSSVIPGSYKLILQMIGLYRSSATEFAANFDLNHGSLGMSNPTELWKKSDREKLLDYGVETVKGGITTAYYINDNTTAQSNKSYLSEDQNVRMTNTAIHVLEDYVKNFIGELNTVSLRKRVQEGANSVLQERLFKGRTYVPAMYRAVCDDTNNPVSVIEQNKLVVSLYASYTPSVKYVLVDHFIVPLSQVQ